MTKKKKDLREAIRSALDAIDGTPYELAARAQEAGVCHRSTVYRYLRGESSISSDVLEWIFEDLGLEVVS